MLLYSVSIGPTFVNLVDIDCYVETILPTLGYVYQMKFFVILHDNIKIVRIILVKLLFRRIW